MIATNSASSPALRIFATHIFPLLQDSVQYKEQLVRCTQETKMSEYQEIFRYLNDPDECYRQDKPSACVVCGLLRPGYRFVQLHEEDYDVRCVCKSCLISGRLAEKNLRANDGDIETVRRQLQERMRELSEEERNALAILRTREIEERTPHPNIFNLFTWPAHCGDYFVYFRRVNADDLDRLAPDGDGKAFLTSYLSDDSADEEFLNGVWEDKLQGFMQFYLWKCPICATYLLTCDSE